MKNWRFAMLVLVLLSGLLALFPTAARCSLVQVDLNSFTRYSDTTGEIYLTTTLTPATFSYCFAKNQSVNVPGTYYGELESLDDTGEKQAAWIMDTYAWSTHGNYGGLDSKQTQAVVQFAIWMVTGQTPSGTAYNELVTYVNTLVNNAAAQTTEVLAAAATKYSFLRLYTNQNGTGEVQGQLVSNAPIPGAAWLLGSGLLGLLGFRRKFIG